MPEVTMKDMLSAGAHFGHQTQRWNPKMAPYIFGPRNGIYIIDLEKTLTHAKEACDAIRSVTAEGGKVLFVATKKQAKITVQEAAARASMPFVTDRWLGGTLTNFATIRRGVEKLQQLETWKEDGTYQALPKKETVGLERKRKKLEATVGGVRDMKGLPSALFVIDPECEKNAVREANKLGIPVFALVDTNCNPDPIDYIIPANDDAIKSVMLFANLIADACLEGGQVFEQRMRASGTQKPKQQEQEGVVNAGPVVEKVTRRQLKIPTEIDYRAEDTEDEEEVKVDAPEGAEDATVEASSEAAATAEAKKDEPQDK